MSTQAIGQKAYQPFIPGLGPNDDPANKVARQNAEAQERGAVFTRREVVEFILNLVGYTVERPLAELRLLEPSFGDGDFLFPALERLIVALKKVSPELKDAEIHISNAITAVELHRPTWERTSQKVVDYLISEGFSKAQANALADKWLVNDDFLLTDALSERFDFVVGNPPYVRQELIPAALLAEYRNRYSTIYDRADLYVPFIERSLMELRDDGHLGFICSDRWMKNKYGGPLRRLIAGHFHLKFHIDMVDTRAFREDVIAYPAITVLRKGEGTKTRIAYRPEISSKNLMDLGLRLNGAGKLTDNSNIQEAEGVTCGSEPWILGSHRGLSLVRKLEGKFPVIEDTGCKVGIGVATGADKVFVAPFNELDVEEDRKLPLVMTRDIESGQISWCGNGVLNPFGEDGALVRLESYPRLSAYLNKHRALIERRHISARNPAFWYRTIDKIYPSLTFTPKLLIPDIKGKAQIVFDNGQFYPHHNLYYITSQEWDLRALHAVLVSGIANLFVSAYSTQMRGGYLRFHAQYLRRIRLPLWRSISDSIKEQLISAGEEPNPSVTQTVMCQLFGFTSEEMGILNDYTYALKPS